MILFYNNVFLYLYIFILFWIFWKLLRVFTSFYIVLQFLVNFCIIICTYVGINNLYLSVCILFHSQKLGIFKNQNLYYISLWYLIKNHIILYYFVTQDNRFVLDYHNLTVGAPSSKGISGHQYSDRGGKVRVLESTSVCGNSIHVYMCT